MPGPYIPEWAPSQPGGPCRNPPDTHNGRVSTRTVLLVEDDRELAETLRDLLIEDHYTVLTAGNGREALDILRKAEPKPMLIVLDLMMPVMSGWELMDVLKSDPELSSIPVIVTTACATRIPSGARQVFNKPLPLDAFLEAISSQSRP
jgi:two-component system, OmpR family, response regulator CpxR